MKQGLFGGTFNPFHNGHIKVISYVKEKFALEKIYIIPCAIPPHKAPINLAPAEIRLKMIKNGIKNLKGLVESDIEIKRKGKSFTIDTIKNFMGNLKNKKSFFYLILGSDAFFDINTWKNFNEIFKLIPVIVMKRAGDKRNLNDIKYYIKNIISKNYIYKNSKNNIFFHPDMKSIYICKVPEIKISSTKIRNLVKKKFCIKSFVSCSVEKIITQKGLYL